MKLHTETAMAAALKDILTQVGALIDDGMIVDVYIAGGMAVHLYTDDRTTTDVDAEFGSRMFFPRGITTEAEIDGRKQIVYLDTSYNSSFALMHENYIRDSRLIDIGIPTIRAHILSPTDLAVSKISRLADNDKEDISSLVRLGLTSAFEIEERAMQSISGYVGGKAMLECNIRDAIAIAMRAEDDRLSASHLP